MDKQYEATLQILELLHTPELDRVWGIVGPGDDPSVSNFIAPLAANGGLLMVSLSTHDDHVNLDITSIKNIYDKLSTEVEMAVPKSSQMRVGMIKSIFG